MTFWVTTVLLSVRLLWPAGIVGAASVTRDDTRDVLEGFSCSVDGAKAWTPMAGSRSVSVARVAGRVAFKMPCNFRGTDIERASWDHQIDQDLSMCQGLEFLFYCSDLSPVSSLTVYLHSGDGWYRGNFDAPDTGQWTSVRIAKSAMHVEGRPGGWSQIDRVRLSAWRGLDEDTVFYVANFGLFGTGGKIVVVRGDSVADRAPEELGAVRQYTSVMSAFLDRASLSHLVLSDLDVTAERLRDTPIVILPHNPAMPETVARELGRFLRAGGKLLACYHLPDSLEPVVGIRSGRHIRQPRSGYFASIRPGEEPLENMPPVTLQASWNIHEASATGVGARVVAWWYTDDGESTGKPAIVAGDNGVYLSHVLMPDDPANKLPLLLSMLGHLVPEVWSDAAQGCLERIGRFGPYDNYEAARQAIADLGAGAGDVLAALERAGQRRGQAFSLLSEDRFAEAIDAAEDAHGILIEAYCLAQRPVAGEHRAFWCHSAFGVAGLSWDEAIKALADNGFTAILPNMLWGGVAFYPSDVLPSYQDLQAKGDQLRLCVDACKKYGVECHVWKVNFNMGWATDQAFVDRVRAEGRVQVSYDGSVSERWLCPSHPDNQALEVESMLEVARSYDVDGLHFDYIRYPGRDSCFCQGCRRRFETAVRQHIPQWPSDVRTDDELAERWLDFRRQQITAVVAAVSERARQIRPKVRVSAAVFRNWPTDRDSVGQDWKLWCERGYLDFVCPMDYFASSATFERAVEQQLTWAGDVRCYPGIGLSVWDEPADVPKLIEQINITRRHQTGGFTIFNYGSREAREVLPLLGNGLTRVDPQ